MSEPFRIEIKQSAEREIRAIDGKGHRQRVVARIQALAQNLRPPGCTKLTEQEAYRIRQGVYRRLYHKRRLTYRRSRKSGPSAGCISESVVTTTHRAVSHWR